MLPYVCTGKGNALSQPLLPPRRSPRKLGTVHVVGNDNQNDQTQHDLDQEINPASIRANECNVNPIYILIQIIL